MLVRLVLNSWAQAILLPWLPKVLDYKHEPLLTAGKDIFLRLWVFLTYIALY